jgi:hypothetical protein
MSAPLKESAIRMTSPIRVTLASRRPSAFKLTAATDLPSAVRQTVAGGDISVLCATWALQQTPGVGESLQLSPSSRIDHNSGLRPTSAVGLTSLLSRTRRVLVTITLQSLNGDRTSDFDGSEPSNQTDSFLGQTMGIVGDLPSSDIEQPSFFEPDGSRILPATNDLESSVPLMTVQSGDDELDAQNVGSETALVMGVVGGILPLLAVVIVLIILWFKNRPIHAGDVPEEDHVEMMSGASASFYHREHIDGLSWSNHLSSSDFGTLKEATVDHPGE